MASTGYWCPTISCKNPDCLPGKTIFLPYPNPPEIFEVQPRWPKADWKAFVVCPWCGQGCEYTFEDVRWGGGTKPCLPQNNFLLRVLLQCDQKDCASPVTIHLPVDISTTQKDRDKKLSSGSSNARCSKGHPPLLPPKILNAQTENDI